ncbi:Putative glycosyltransferase EpsE [Caballeronia terrestris]|uniref:Glycosyltransferase EpsE n=1 Tax=Caballeronia terrestris TaxID=1226301 RepID=A0A158I087_9BURK|nr:glycosyltransferase [Caballeronia terrestris]SAL50024.1 Putative glycosyltransferase EpsE [Caballeronia terrestris]
MPATPHREPAAPLASLMLITFNQQHSVADAIRGALSQTWTPLEVLISDDASTDDTFAIAEKCVSGYDGPHTVRLFRNETNLGISAHLSALAARASGQLLFVAAGDDISMPQRCERVMNAWIESGKRYGLIATDLQDLDAAGNVHDILTVTDLSGYQGFDDWSRSRPHVVGAAHAWARRLFTEFGPMEPGIYGEDQIMVFRAIMSGGAFTLREPLVQYRRGGLSRKRRWRTPGEFVARIKLANVNGTGETRQLQRDANRVGAGDKMRALLAKKAAREEYVAAVFSNQPLSRKLAMLVGAANVSAGFRIRMFVYATCPWLLSPFFFIKWHLRA